MRNMWSECRRWWNKYGGRYLVRGGEVVALAGGWQPERIVVLEFESSDQAQDYLTSPEYLSPGPPPAEIHHFPGHYRPGL